MTKEQAIVIIRQEYLCVDRDCNIEKNCGNCDLAMPSKEPILEAYKMAIKALEKESCEDVISRAAVVEVLNKLDRYVAEELTLCDTERKFPQNEVFIVDDIYEEIVEKLPSVMPVEKVGHWITLKDEYGDVNEAVCSCCDSNGNHKWVYCPYCGTKMISSTGEERSDKE